MTLLIQQDLESFLIQRNSGELLQNSKTENGPISDRNRILLINQVHAYLKLKFENVKKTHMVQAAKTLVFMVPRLKDKTEGEMAGFVCF